MAAPANKRAKLFWGLYIFKHHVVQVQDTYSMSTRYPVV